MRHAFENQNTNPSLAAAAEKVVLGMTAFALIAICSGLAILTFWPDVAAQNIDHLRDIIGDEAVAQLETVALNIQDHVKQFEYQVSLAKPAAPWGNATPILIVIRVTPVSTSFRPSSPTSAPTSLPTESNTITLPATNLPPNAHPVPSNPTTVPTIRPIETSNGTQSVSSLPTSTRPVLSSPTGAPTSLATAANIVMLPATHLSVSTNPAPTSPTAAPTILLTLTSTNTSPATGLPVGATPVSSSPTATPTSLATVTSLPTWQLSSMTPFGELGGEGQWSPYLQTADGKTTLAYRTFLQPDPNRPYSMTAIVAFDLRTTRLHFVLGSIEPTPTSPQSSRTGMIPAADMQPGILLATFNGGFKARHGHYGAMADGLIALPPIDGLATVAMYADGQVQIGEWGTAIKDSADLVAWRQSGKFLIHNSQIDPSTSQSNELWGATIRGDVITWRSALALSADGRTLYYVAGQQVDITNLTKTLVQLGVGEALQLDVNSFWVHFAAIRNNGSDLIAEPLLNGMFQEVDRYLKSSTRDFFYITAVTK